MPQKKPNIEIRSSLEVRAGEGEGIFEGYLTIWDTVDSYGSTFQRGAFSKTIQERGTRIKAMYDHEELIGKIIEIREDDKGVFCRGKLSMGVQKAREVFEFLKDGAVEELSFGFRSVKDKFVDGVRVITEVMLFEVSPVVFPANEQAAIVSVRKEGQNMPDEQRAKQLEETLRLRDLRDGQYRVTSALYETLEDIWWANDSSPENVLGRLDEAIQTFSAHYMEWAAAFVAEFWADEQRSAPGSNELANAMAGYLNAEQATIDEIATRSAFTADELRSLRSGKTIEAREKLLTLPDDVQAAHKEVRAAAFEKLFGELRDGFTAIEKRRFAALLEPAEKQSEPDEMRTALSSIKSFRKSLEGSHA